MGLWFVALLIENAIAGRPELGCRWKFVVIDRGRDGRGSRSGGASVALGTATARARQHDGRIIDNRVKARSIIVRPLSQLLLMMMMPFSSSRSG